jgi:hypothetical protein
MNGAALAGKKSGCRENMRAGAKAADRHAAILFFAKPGEDRLVAEILDIDA